MDIKNVNANVRALVADDSIVTQRLMAIVLEQMGVAADFTDNGAKALEHLKNVNYDIVFLDVVMPGLDGYQVCKRIKANRSSKDIPVIMLTGKDGTFDKIKGKMAGANQYLTKPVDTSKIVNVLKQFLPLYHLRSDSGKPKNWVESAIKKQPTVSEPTAPASDLQVETSTNAQLSHAEKIIKIRKMLGK